MTRVPSRAAPVVWATMVIRMDFHRGRRLHGSEAHQHQQNQQGSRGLSEHTHT